MPRLPSAALRLPAAFVVALALSACRYFPSHEEVYIPVPLRIGEMRVEGTDTSYVLTGSGYEAVAFAREVLLEARPELDGAAIVFHRHFGVEPRTIRILYEAVDDRRAARRLPGDTLPQPPRRRGSGEIRVNVARPRDRSDPVRLPPIAGALAREWVIAFERGAGGVDSVTGIGPEPAAATASLPEWFRVGAAELIARSPRQQFSIALLQRQLNEAPPLEQFFRAPSPEPDDTATTGPRRRVPQPAAMQRLDAVELWRAQSIAVMRYLADREGPEFVGVVAERLLRGEDMLDITRDTRSLASTPAALDEAWRAWVSAVAPAVRGGRG